MSKPKPKMFQEASPSLLSRCLKRSSTLNSLAVLNILILALLTLAVFFGSFLNLQFIINRRILAFTSVKIDNFHKAKFGSLDDAFTLLWFPEDVAVID
ncbi:hypothetical protein L596_017249 [Steinernema carpocapsae]|uniref:Uncharacterized protein n=1 Tax=Steinernema carpocapsae TaxID=34508 RepID=A0A4U5N1C1_STECR|nr:hypothetical protein L596_017249 [Steinernema carpocapsae]